MRLSVEEAERLGLGVRPFSSSSSLFRLIGFVFAAIRFRKLAFAVILLRKCVSTNCCPRTYSRNCVFANFVSLSVVSQMRFRKLCIAAICFANEFAVVFFENACSRNKLQ